MNELNQKRPSGITAIAIIWLLSGLANVYLNFQLMSQDVEVLPYISNPSVHEWFSFGVPVELLLATLGIILGFLQIVTVFGLWTGKTYSYKLALAVPIILIIFNVSSLGLYATAPAELDLSSGVATSAMMLVWSIIWAAIYWNYLGKIHVKTYLGVVQPRIIPQATLSSVNQEKPIDVKEEKATSELPKFYCRYCGSENERDAIYCDSCGKHLKES